MQTIGLEYLLQKKIELQKNLSKLIDDENAVSGAIQLVDMMISELQESEKSAVVSEISQA